MVFLLFSLDDERIRIQEAQKRMDSDPEYCLCLSDRIDLKVRISLLVLFSSKFHLKSVCCLRSLIGLLQFYELVS
jgi:hypothetical protein